jgi:hypothetical protein
MYVNDVGAAEKRLSAYIFGFNHYSKQRSSRMFPPESNFEHSTLSLNLSF